MTKDLLRATVFITLSFALGAVATIHEARATAHGLTALISKVLGL